MDHVTKEMLPNEIEAKPQRVTVVDFDMPFGAMVWFMVKLVIAAIPAGIILAFFGFALVALLGGLSTSMLSPR